MCFVPWDVRRESECVCVLEIGGNVRDPTQCGAYLEMLGEEERETLYNKLLFLQGRHCETLLRNFTSMHDNV